MPIRLIQRAPFNPETIRLLVLAYERACENAAPNVTFREALAKRIIEAASGGERDLEKLIKYALGINAALGSDRTSTEQMAARQGPSSAS